MLPSGSMTMTASGRAFRVASRVIFGGEQLAQAGAAVLGEGLGHAVEAGGELAELVRPGDAHPAGRSSPAEGIDRGGQLANRRPQDRAGQPQGHQRSTREVTSESRHTTQVARAASSRARTPACLHRPEVRLADLARRHDRLAQQRVDLLVIKPQARSPRPAAASRLVARLAIGIPRSRAGRRGRLLSSPVCISGPQCAERLVKAAALPRRGRACACAASPVSASSRASSSRSSASASSAVKSMVSWLSRRGGPGRRRGGQRSGRSEPAGDGGRDEQAARQEEARLQPMPSHGVAPCFPGVTPARSVSACAGAWWRRCPGCGPPPRRKAARATTRAMCSRSICLQRHVAPSTGAIVAAAAAVPAPRSIGAAVPGLPTHQDAGRDQDHGPLDGVAQLAQVARPGVGGDRLLAARGEGQVGRGPGVHSKKRR